MKFSTFAIVGLGLAASTVQGAPLSKRIAQSISASTVKWEQVCVRRIDLFSGAIFLHLYSARQVAERNVTPFL